MFIKQEETLIAVPLRVDEAEETQRERPHSALPSLQYPSSREPSSWLSSYVTRSPAPRYSPYRRGTSTAGTPPYRPVTPIRSPTPLEQPVNWDRVYNQPAVTTDATLHAPSTLASTLVQPQGLDLYRAFVPSEVSDIIRQGLLLGAQQARDEERRGRLQERVVEVRARVEARLHREERLPNRAPAAHYNLVPRRWFRGPEPPLLLRHRISPLRPRSVLRRPSRYC